MNKAESSTKKKLDLPEKGKMLFVEENGKVYIQKA
jgi:hypothetical protein